MKIQESKENYLETILMLEKKNGSVRSIDIAREMNFSKPSVSRAMGLLKEQGYIEMKSDGMITLTKEGRKRAEEVLEKHKLLTRYLHEILGISPETAEADACHIEHVISEETFVAIRKALK